MRIGIDARMLGNTGIGRYLRNLLIELAKLDQQNEYVLLMQPNTPPVEQENFIAAYLPVYTPIYSPAEQYRFPLEIRKRRVELMHYPNFNLPLISCCPYVVTIHDLIYYLHPDECPSKLAHYYASFMMKHAIKHAKMVITDSQHSQDDLTRYFQVSPEKIRVIPIGADEQCFRCASGDAQTLPIHRERLYERYGILNRYILYVGKHHLYKNIATLIRAFMTHPTVYEQTQLVIAGKRDPRRKELYELAERSDPGGRIIFTDFVPDDRLFDLYRGAALFVFPSLYEGFGLPPLEAMACGVPVICSNAASLPEVVGDAAILVNPTNAHEMADAMQAVLTDSALYQSLQAKGRAQAQRFSWERAARQLLDVYTQSA